MWANWIATLTVGLPSKQTVTASLQGCSVDCGVNTENHRKKIGSLNVMGNGKSYERIRTVILNEGSLLLRVGERVTLWRIILFQYSCKYLGIILRSDLSWVDQVNYTVKKAWKALHFTMRTLKKGNSNTKSLAYRSLVRPILEYGAACWDPYREG